MALYYSGKPRAQILHQRVALFHEIQADYTKLKPQLSGLERFDLDKQKLNNAILIIYRLYFHKLDDFAALDALHECDLRATIQDIISLAKSKPDDPFAAIHQVVASAHYHPEVNCISGPITARQTTPSPHSPVGSRMPSG
jgi:predicted aminopeptidase